MIKTVGPKLSGLGHYLVNKGYLKEQQALIALQECVHKNLSFLQYLGQSHLIEYRELAKATSEYFSLPFVDIDNYALNQLPIDLLSSELILKNRVLPLDKKMNHMTLAVADPTLVDINELNFITNMNCTFAIVEANKLEQIIHILYSKKIQNDLEENIELENNHSQIRGMEIATTIDLQAISSHESPIVKLLNRIVLDAISQGASDIHFEPFETDFRIRFRIDGILYETYRQPKNVGNYFGARLKILANLDISERRLPQDGRLSMTLPNYCKIDFRLNTCPTCHGERATLRILQASSMLLDTHALGMDEIQKSAFHRALSNSHGMILVTGPTGSGKTITLYSALDKLNSNQVNILTIEDPIEIQMQGLNQVQINDKAGLDFTAALRAFLRQDPDIIMVGEIRDNTTAEIAIKAAQTGHLVLATLHTNSTTQSLARLRNMGISPFNMATTIILVIAQRLVRKLCTQCKEKIKLPTNILLAEGFGREEIKQLTIFKANGCPECQNGYKGRTGIYEVLPISMAMSNLIMKNVNSFELAEQVKKENVVTLRHSALYKVKEGITSLAEINRVIKA